MVSGWGLVPDDQRNEMKRRGGVLVCIEGGCRRRMKTDPVSTPEF